MDGIFQEWLNANSGRAFPLAENSLRTGASGLVKIPDSLIVAAQICMTPAYAAGLFYIHSLSVSPSTITPSAAMALPASTRITSPTFSWPAATSSVVRSRGQPAMRKADAMEAWDNAAFEDQEAVPIYLNPAISSYYG